MSLVLSITFGRVFAPLMTETYIQDIAESLRLLRVSIDDLSEQLCRTIDILSTSVDEINQTLLSRLEAS